MANNDDQDFPNGEQENFRNFEASADEAGLDAGAPAVASSSKKAVFGLVAFFMVLGLIVYFVLGGIGEEEAPPPKDDLAEALGNVAGQATGVAPPVAAPIIAPPVPPAPEIIATPEPTTPVVAPPPPPSISAMAVNTPTDQAYQERIRSGMLVMSAAADPETPTNSQTSIANKPLESNPNLAFAEKAYANSGGGNVTSAGRVENLDRTLIEGKIIYAVIESAINTDLPGKIRAVVSRDVYPESGRLILIPKGSRIIGTYNNNFLFGQARIYIAWTRVIRPDGVDISINSPAIDGLGRAGVQASYVDNKYLELFTAAALTTTITIGTAIAGENLVDDPTITETTTAEGNTVTTTSPAAEGVRDAVDNISDMSKSAIDKVLKLGPTAYLDQGTPVSIMVNDDLTFPEEMIVSNRNLE